MTKQIGRAYRRNRRGSWLLAACVVVIAVAAIPIASGHGPSTGTISGKVWQDTNEDKAIGDASLEPGQQFQVNLYLKTVGTVYLPVQSKTSDANGNYTFSNVPFGPSYLVCEHLPDAVTNKWSQTTPNVQTLPCGTIPYNKPNGRVLAPFSASATGVDFGNVQSIALDTSSPSAAGCGGSNFSGALVTSGFEYEAKLTLPTGTCKAGSLVMLTYQSGSTRVATLHPPVGVSGTKYPVVERFKWTGVGQDQNPITLKYNDNPPYDAAGSHVMKMCNNDPRSPAGTGYTLGASPELALPTGETSCMIVSTEAAGNGGTYEAYVYSSVDGWKGGG